MPSATAPLSVGGTEVTLATVLPAAWAGMVRNDGRRYLGLQVQSRSGDASRDLGWALEQVVAAGPGTSVVPTGLPGEGPRLQDLLDPAPIEVTVHQGFDFWTEGTEGLEDHDEQAIAAANESVVPTARVAGVQSAYWCRMRERSHLRWVLPEDEDPLLDALSRLSVSGGLSLGEGTRFVGSFRAHGLLVPVWDLPHAMEAAELEEPAVAFRARLDEALADTAPLSPEARRARAGLVNRQLTLR